MVDEILMFKLLLILSTSLGTIYRTIYSDDIIGVKKFLVSLVFSGFLGMIMIYYVEENEMKKWVAITIAMGVGLVSPNLASFAIGVGRKSEKRITDTATDLLEKKILPMFSGKSTHTNEKDDDNSHH